jgi:hypothetical protein
MNTDPIPPDVGYAAEHWTAHISHLNTTEKLLDDSVHRHITKNLAEALHLNAVLDWGMIMEMRAYDMKWIFDLIEWRKVEDNYISSVMEYLTTFNSVLLPNWNI